MKSVWTKVGAAALIGVVLANAFIPYAFATDAVPGADSTETIGAIEQSEYFSLESESLNWVTSRSLGDRMMAGKSEDLTVGQPGRGGWTTTGSSMGLPLLHFQCLMSCLSPLGMKTLIIFVFPFW